MGLVVGLSQIAAEVNEELGDIAAAIGVLDQSYSYAGLSGHHGAANGSVWLDANDGAIPDGNNCVLACDASLGDVVGAGENNGSTAP